MNPTRQHDMPIQTALPDFMILHPDTNPEWIDEDKIWLDDDPEQLDDDGGRVDDDEE